MPTRRRLLGSIALASAGVTAGCLGYSSNAVALGDLAMHIPSDADVEFAIIITRNDQPALERSLTVPAGIRSDEYMVVEREWPVTPASYSIEYSYEYEYGDDVGGGSGGGAGSHSVTADDVEASGLGGCLALVVRFGENPDIDPREDIVLRDAGAVDGADC